MLLSVSIPADIPPPTLIPNVPFKSAVGISTSFTLIVVIIGRASTPPCTASIPALNSSLTSQTILGLAATPLTISEEESSSISLEGSGDVAPSSSSNFTCPYKFLEAPPYSGSFDKWILGVAVPVTSPSTLPMIFPPTTVKSPWIFEGPAFIPPNTESFFSSGSYDNPIAFLVIFVSLSSPEELATKIL